MSERSFELPNQLTLFGAEPRLLPSEEGPSGADEPPADSAATPSACRHCLLAEDSPPRWLACLGLIRRLWSATPAGEAGLEDFRNTPAEGCSDEEAALEFWRRLQVAESADCPEEILHQARRSMKRLRPDLHALYMRRAAETRGS